MCGGPRQLEAGAVASGSTRGRLGDRGAYTMYSCHLVAGSVTIVLNGHLICADRVGGKWTLIFDKDGERYVR